MLLAVWSPKGGSGTSVVAASVALHLSVRGPVRLADLGGDQPALLGLPAHPGAPGSAGRGLAGWLAGGPAAATERLDELAVAVCPGLTLLPRGAGSLVGLAPEAGAGLAVGLRDPGPTILDAGPADVPVVRAALEVADHLVVVLRPCYTALRRAVADPLVERSSGVVLVEEPGRALGAADVAAVLDRPVLARIPVRPDIARSVDAGTFGRRLPPPLGRAAAAVLDRLADSAGRGWAA